MDSATTDWHWFWFGWFAIIILTVIACAIAASSSVLSSRTHNNGKAYSNIIYKVRSITKVSKNMIVIEIIAHSEHVVRWPAQAGQWDDGFTPSRGVRCQ
jgi:hypothetical protein